jgi:hypothetical protein
LDVLGLALTGKPVTHVQCMLQFMLRSFRVFRDILFTHVQCILHPILRSFRVFQTFYLPMSGAYYTQCSGVFGFSRHFIYPCLVYVTSDAPDISGSPGDLIYPRMLWSFWVFWKILISHVQCILNPMPQSFRVFQDILFTPMLRSFRVFRDILFTHVWGI